MEVIIVPKKVEQINDYLFIDTYKSNKIKTGVNEMTVNDSEMCVRWKKEAWSIWYTYSTCHILHVVHLMTLST